MMSENVSLWGGRFKSGPSDSLVNLSRSNISYFRLYREDLAGSRAHSQELHRAGLLTEDELAKFLNAFDAIEADITKNGVHQISTDEDVHTYLERLLMERLDSLGGKLRAGRSRNDQTANNTRLYLRRKSREIVIRLLDVQYALSKQAKSNVDTIVPGFTHLQPAQPVSFAHQLMAHGQSLLRDIERFKDWDKRFSTSPLGAAALAGSSIARRPDLSALDLGYTGACENSIDAVASRDLVAEFLFICTTLAINLSRLSEEIIMWSSKQFGWVKLHDSYSTGSSIMPQKKNPDIAELTRGMSGTIIGNVTGMLATMKAMPLAYNRDLAEDKRGLFETVDLLELILPAFAGMVDTLEFNVDRMRSDAPKGFTLATEIADWLARQNVPFSEAHEITGAVVRYCEENNKELQELDATDVVRIDPRLTSDVLKFLDLDAALASRDGYNGTAPVRVKEQIARFENALEQAQRWASTSVTPLVSQNQAEAV